VILRDITRRKQMEQQLVQARKMEAVGRLAGAVAHEFNNVLTAIVGLGDLLLDSLGSDDRRADDAREVKALAEKAAILTRQLLAFGRRQPLQPRVLDLNARVSTIERMVRQIIGKQIELVFELAPDLPGVKADPAQLDQVILNLVLNARDAMSGGGTLAVRTDVARLDQAACQALQDARPGQFVRLTVTDTGSGIADEDLGRVFEPFFTTKQNWEGKGLGLATAYKIIQKHQGKISVSSEAGKGTLFTLTFPALQKSMHLR
jgi:two-component system cell cycle sensor histidine kinase/response regulator CckA